MPVKRRESSSCITQSEILMSCSGYLLVNRARLTHHECRRKLAPTLVSGLSGAGFWYAAGDGRKHRAHLGAGRENRAPGGSHQRLARAGALALRGFAADRAAGFNARRRQALRFKRSGAELKNRMWWGQFKLQIMIVGSVSVRGPHSSKIGGWGRRGRGGGVGCRPRVPVPAAPVRGRLQPPPPSRCLRSASRPLSAAHPRPPQCLP